MTARDVLAAFRKWLWLVVVCAILATAVSWWRTRDEPPLYHTSATLIVSQAVDKANPTYADFEVGGDLARTYVELTHLESVLRAVARDLDAEEQWSALRHQIQTNVTPNGLILKVSAIDPYPERARAIANATARQVTVMAGGLESSDIPSGFIEEQAASFPPKIQAAQAKVAQLEVELEAATGARRIQELQDQIDSLQMLIEDWQRSFARYQQLLGQGRVNTLTILEQAPLPSVPLPAPWHRTMPLAAVVGALVGAAAAALMEHLDDTIKTSDEAAAAVLAGSLGAIPLIPPDMRSKHLVMRAYPSSSIAEAFRSVRTTLQFLVLDRALKSLVVTSAGPAEGKSTLTSNIAEALAETGLHVTLVDADLRRPMQHKLFRLPNDTGLTDLLLDEEPDLGKLMEHLHTPLPRLCVLTSGPQPPNPSELLGTFRMSRLVRLLESACDLVIMDCAPILPVSDGLALASQTGGVVFVVAADMTRRPEARSAGVSLRQAGANLVGVVLNRSRAPRGGAHFYLALRGPGERSQERRRPFGWTAPRSSRNASAPSEPRG